MSVSGLAKASVVLLGLALVAGQLVPSWPFELCSHSPLHQAALLVALAGGLAATKPRAPGWIGAALTLALANGAVVAPGLRGEDGASGDATLRVASLNVYFKSERYADAAAFLLGSEAEVLVLLEVTPEWVDQIEILRARWPHVVAEPRETSSGIMLLSRLPIERHEVIDLTGAGRVTLKVTVRSADGPVTLIAFHPSPPTTPGRARRRNDEMRAVALIARSAALEGPTLLVGDFNCTPWSPVFRRLVHETKFVDSRAGRGVQATWPSLLGCLGIPIDHAIVSSGLRVVERSVGPQVGSDHRGIVVGLEVVPGAPPVAPR